MESGPRAAGQTPGPRGIRSAGGLHCDVLLSRRSLFGNGHGDGEDAFVVGGFDVLLVGTRRQGDRADE
jgi:hypothetical protein